MTCFASYVAIASYISNKSCSIKTTNSDNRVAISAITSGISTDKMQVANGFLELLFDTILIL